MKYKVGQKVRVVDDYWFTPYVENQICRLQTNRVVTIRKLLPRDSHGYDRPKGLYMLKEISTCKWEEQWLEELPLNRFELMDV